MDGKIWEFDNDNYFGQVLTYCSVCEEESYGNAYGIRAENILDYVICDNCNCMTENYVGVKSDGGLGEIPF